MVKAKPRNNRNKATKLTTGVTGVYNDNFDNGHRHSTYLLSVMSARTNFEYQDLRSVVLYLASNEENKVFHCLGSSCPTTFGGQ
jgi:hypothetical protein